MYEDREDAELRRRDRARHLRRFPDPRDRKVIAMRIAADLDPAQLRIRSLADLLAEPDDPACWLIEPVLPENGLMMLHGRRGIGKTWMALEIALAAAMGKPAFGWEFRQPMKVLYVEGDMPKRHFKLRAKALAAARGASDEERRRLDFCLATDQEERMPKLDTIRGQYAMSDRMNGARLLVLDSLGSLTDSTEHGGHGALLFRDWLLSTRQSCAVVVVHHAGRREAPRGPGSIEDPYDSVVFLREPEDKRARDGWRAQMKVQKTRHAEGDGLQSLDLRMTIVDGAPTWEWTEADEIPLDTFVRLWTAGKTVEQIAERTGWSRAKLYRLRADALERGLIEARPTAA